MQKSLLISLLALCNIVANAQWNSDPTVNNPVITAAEAATTKSSLVSTTDLSGNAFFAWIETRDVDADIYIQKMYADGTRAFPAEGIIVCNAAGNQSNVDIFPDGSGGVILVWQDPRNGNNDIYGQRVDANGAVQWNPNGVAISNLPTSEIVPKVSAASFTDFMVVWRDSRLFEGTTDNGIDLYCNKFSTADGSKIWGSDVAVVSASGTQQNQTINPDKVGGYTIVWEDARVSSGARDIYAQRITSAGTKLWGTGTPNNGLKVSTSGAYTNVNPVSIFDGADGVGIAFQSTRTPGNSSDADIYFQRVISTGSLLAASEIPIAVVTGSNQTDPEITYVGAGFAIGWFDLRNSATFGRDLYGRGVSTTGIPLLPENGFPIAANLTGSQPQTNFKVVPADNSSNSAIYVWDDARNGTSDINVYAQRITPNPLNPTEMVVFPGWAVNGMPVATRPASNQTGVAVAPLSGKNFNNVIVGWRDNRSTAPTITATQDIYASMLQLDGTLPVVLLEFSAVGKTDRIETSWKTSSEINVKEYIVEKSADGRNFTAIGRVSAKGGAGANSYNFTDLKPLNGDNFYRLQSVDRDGAKDYSRIARVNMARKLPAQVTVQPNPISGIGKVVFNNYENGSYQLRVVDARGAVVQSKSVNIQSAIQQLDVNMSGLANGRYWVQVLKNGTPVSNTAVQKQ